jgi:hypothetical protein
LGAVGAEWNDLHVDGVAYIDTINGFAATGDVNFGDNNKAQFGAGSDLQIYHNGSHSFIEDKGTGNLYIDGSASVYIRGDTGNTTSAVFNDGGSAALYHNGSEKLATTSTGIDVTGNVVSDGLTVDGQSSLNDITTITSTNPRLRFIESDTTDVNTDIRNSGGDFQIGTINDAVNSVKPRFNIDHATGDISFYEDTGTTAKLTWDASAETLNFADNGKAVFGASSDLQIYHDGLNSHITDAGTGNLILKATDFVLESGGTGGIDVTGVITTDGMTTSADINFGDNDKAVFGAGSDLQIYHDASLGQSRIQDVGTGSLYLQGDGGVVITNSAGTSTSATFASTGATSLSFNGTTKFATTTTGIDVTGTVNADDYYVKTGGHIKFDFNGSSTPFTGVNSPHIFAGSGPSGSYLAGTLNLQSRPTLDRDINLITGSTPSKTLTAHGNKDISFYEDTGTTAKLFWDASAESLGIHQVTRCYSFQSLTPQALQE